MDIQPVKKYKIPKYPDKKKRRAAWAVPAAGLLAASLAGLAGCERNTSGDNPSSVVTFIIDESGIFFCAEPPEQTGEAAVYTDRERAVNILREELGTYIGPVQYTEIVTMRLPVIWPDENGERRIRKSTNDYSRISDMTYTENAKLHIMYITGEDVKSFAADGAEVTADAAAVYECAKIIAEGNTNIAVFCDPCMESEEQSEEELRRQAREFAAWFTARRGW